MTAGRVALAVALAVLTLPVAAKEPIDARVDTGLPVPLRGVGIDQRLGEALPLDLRFADEEGARSASATTSTSGSRSSSRSSTTAARCCAPGADGLARARRRSASTPGEEFDVVTVSFDPRRRRWRRRRSRRYVEQYGRPGGGGRLALPHRRRGGDRRSSRDAVGFRYAYDAKPTEFAHASGDHGRHARGQARRATSTASIRAADLRLGAGRGVGRRSARSIDQLLLLCFQYDPTTRQVQRRDDARAAHRRRSLTVAASRRC